MAETQTAAEAKPATTRTRNRSTAAKKPEAAPVAEAATGNRTVLELVPAGVTKSYSKWQAPEGSGCAGNFYAPLGVTAVKVAYTTP